MNGTNNISARESFKQARDLFYDALRDKFPPGPPGDAACRKWVMGLVLTQGEIRCEVELNATNNIYTFAINENQANSTNVLFNTEKRLPIQESICATEMYLFVWRPVDSAGTPSRTGINSLLRTYGNTQDFTAASAQAIDSTFYSHGSFTFKRNQQVLVPYRGLLNHWYKPMTQMTAPLGAAAPGDQIRGVEDGGCTLEPNLCLIGSSQNVLQIELKTNMASVDSFTRAVVIFRGPYAQNSTSVN